MEWFIAWLWQGLLLVGVVGLLFSLTPRISASTRYAIWWLALGVVVAMPWLTAPSAVSDSSTAMLPAAGPVGDSIPRSGAPLVLPAIPVELVLLMLGTWLAYAGVRVTRLVRGVRELRAMQRSCVPFPRESEARLPRWRAVRGDGRVATLCLSRRVRIASVLGLGRPIIAIPERLADSLSADELDQVVLHEHGHVRRWDDWARLCQATIEAFVGFHPAVWVISRRLNLEREVACDDWALAHGGRRRDYAVCLTKVAGASRAPHTGLAPGLALPRATLSRRVARLLDRRRNISVPVAPGVVVAGVGCLAILVGVLSGVSPVVAFESIRWTGPSVRPAVGQVAMTDPFEASSPMPVPPVAVRPAESRARGAGGPDTGPPVSAPLPAIVSSDGGEIIVTGAPSGLAPFRVDEPSPFDARARAALLDELAPVEGTIAGDGLASIRSTLRPPETPRSRPWSRAADAGITIGSKTKAASLATANFFSRVGKSIARAF